MELSRRRSQNLLAQIFGWSDTSARDVEYSIAIIVTKISVNILRDFSSMPAQLSLDPARTAVLRMDLQAGIVSIYVKDQELLARAASVLQRARASECAPSMYKSAFVPIFPKSAR